MKLLKTFLRMPLKQKLMIPRIFWLMAFYKHQVHRRAFSSLAPKIGPLHYQTPVAASPRDAILVHELMQAMFRRFGWKDSCLIRGLTAKRILNSMGHKCTLYMGVCREEGQGMRAHAWLRCGKCIVTGGDAMAGFTVTATFGDP